LSQKPDIVVLGSVDPPVEEAMSDIQPAIGDGRHTYRKGYWPGRLNFFELGR
jgi:hypothetical protein